MSTTVASNPDYISGNQAVKVLGWTWHRFLRAVANGEIRTAKLPGGRDVRYRLQDVEQLRDANGAGRPKAG